MYITVKEAARRINKSIPFIHYLIQTNRLKAEKKGRDYIIIENEINKYKEIEIKKYQDKINKLSE